MRKRQIVKIDADRCTGCGLCVSPCAEGAIQIVDGKAKVVREELCDGVGFCIGACPEGALSIEEREAQEFSEQAVEEHLRGRPKTYISQTCFNCGQSEEKRVLLPCRKDGKSVWVCTRCLPPLIHG